jgi:DNA-binding PadR family transcriptional regulator
MPSAIPPVRDLVALTVLALLWEQPLHPYGMQVLIRDRHKTFAAGKTRALYHAVERLAEAGFIEPTESERVGRRPERTSYQITPVGREELDQRLVRLISSEVGEPVVLEAGLSFLCILKMDVALDALRQRVTLLEVTQAIGESTCQALLQKAGLTRHMLLEHEYGMALVRAELAWVQSLVQDIETKRFSWEGRWWEKSTAPSANKKES